MGVEKKKNSCILGKFTLLNKLVKQAFTPTRASSKLYPADSDVFQDDTSSTNG